MVQQGLQPVIAHDIRQHGRAKKRVRDDTRAAPKEKAAEWPKRQNMEHARQDDEQQHRRELPASDESRS